MGIEVDAVETCNCLLERVLPDFASNGDVELLRRFLVLGIRKVEIVDVRKLYWSMHSISKRGKRLGMPFLFS